MSGIGLLHEGLGFFRRFFFNERLMPPTFEEMILRLVTIQGGFSAWAEILISLGVERNLTPLQIEKVIL